MLLWRHVLSCHPLQALYHTDLALAVIFAVNWVFWFWVAEDRLRYVFSFFSFVDAVTIIPAFVLYGVSAFVSQHIPGLNFLRVLRSSCKPSWHCCRARSALNLCPCKHTNLPLLLPTHPWPETAGLPSLHLSVGKEHARSAAWQDNSESPTRLGLSGIWAYMCIHLRLTYARMRLMWSWMSLASAEGCSLPDYCCGSDAQL